MKKKFFSITLIFAIMLLFVSIPASAESEKYDYRGMLLYTINDKAKQRLRLQTAIYTNFNSNT